MIGLTIKYALIVSAKSSAPQAADCAASAPPTQRHHHHDAVEARVVAERIEPAGLPGRDAPDPFACHTDAQAATLQRLVRLLMIEDRKSSAGAAGAANSSQLLLRKLRAEIPDRRSTCRTNGFSWPVGWLPALYARNLPCPRWLRYASARMPRAELSVQRKRTL